MSGKQRGPKKTTKSKKGSESWVRLLICLWVKNRYPQWNPGKWKSRLKPAVPSCLILTHSHFLCHCSSAGWRVCSKAPAKAQLLMLTSERFPSDSVCCFDPQLMALEVKRVTPKWTPGKWKEVSISWWFNFDPYPHGYGSKPQFSPGEHPIQSNR